MSTASQPASQPRGNIFLFFISLMKKANKASNFPWAQHNSVYWKYPFIPPVSSVADFVGNKQKKILVLFNNNNKGHFLWLARFLAHIPARRASHPFIHLSTFRLKCAEPFFHHHHHRRVMRAFLLLPKQTNNLQATACTYLQSSSWFLSIWFIFLRVALHIFFLSSLQPFIPMGLAWSPIFAKQRTNHACEIIIFYYNSWAMELLLIEWEKTKWWCNLDGSLLHVLESKKFYPLCSRRLGLPKCHVLFSCSLASSKHFWFQLLAPVLIC